MFSFEFLETIFNEKYSVMSSYTRSVSAVLRSNCIFKQSSLYWMNSQRFIGYQCKPLPSLHGGSLKITLTVPLISPNSAEKKYLQITDPIYWEGEILRNGNRGGGGGFQNNTFIPRIQDNRFPSFPTSSFIQIKSTRILEFTTHRLKLQTNSFLISNLHLSIKISLRQVVLLQTLIRSHQIRPCSLNKVLLTPDIT